MSRTTTPNRVTLAAAAFAFALAGAAGSALAADYSTSTKPVKPPHHPHHVSLSVSHQCSQEANAQGLHGKARREFRYRCIKEHTHHTASAAHARHVAHEHHAKKTTTAANSAPQKKLIKSTGPKPKTEKTS